MRLSEEDCRMFAEKSLRASSDEVAALAREVLELREAVKWLTCDDVPHKLNEQHSIGEPCPVLARLAPPALGGEG